MKECLVCGKESGIKFNRKNFNILECPSCGMIFVDPSQVKEDYLEQYRENTSSTLEYYKKTEEYDIRSFSERLVYLKKYFPENSSLLEIGSNTGTFLKTAKKFGWYVEGVEPNSRTCEHIKKEDQGIGVYNSFFDNEFAESHGEKYDMIYSSDVIEHVSDPVSFLKNSKKMLNQGGLIVTVTPDFDNALTKIFQIKPTEHLTYMNKRNINELFKRSGLELIEARNIHRYRNISAMLHSTTFTDNKNSGILMPVVKLIKMLGLERMIEHLLDLFKEDMMIISR